jgi:hypothetical protein
MGKGDIMKTQTASKPYRVGVFSNVAHADEAVHRLRAEGFTKDELLVICSDESKATDIGGQNKASPAGAHTPGAIAAGGLAGAAIGGLALVAASTVTGGLALLGAGVLIGGGAIAGAFTGAMAEIGDSPEIYYQDAVRLGKILVSVEAHGEGSWMRLAQAERIFEECGAEPVALN